MSDRVRDQYEAYPYPSRDPADEAKRLVIGSPSNLLEVNHYLFAGRRDFAKPFRALVAGGGTGDATIMLAQQLADAGSPAEVVYLDLSETSRGIAEARAAARGLANIRFVSGVLAISQSQMMLIPSERARARASWKETPSCEPAFCPASRNSSASCALSAIGFSHNTCLPAAAACSVNGTCR